MNVDSNYNTNNLIKSLEVEGYCILNNAIHDNVLKEIRKELAQLESEATSPNANNGDRIIKHDDVRFMIHHLQFEKCPQVHNIITNGLGRQILTLATNDNLVCTGATYAHCKPGYPGIPLHTDYDPYGSNVYRPSNPVAIRILYYLDNLTPEKAPLRLLPYSHVSLHKSRHHDLEFQEKVEGELEFECKAGTAVMFNPKMFHGVGPNTTNESRRVMAITYRPRWAKPLHTVEEHGAENISRLSADLLPFFQDLNN